MRTRGSMFDGHKNVIREMIREGHTYRKIFDDLFGEELYSYASFAGYLNREGLTVKNLTIKYPCEGCDKRITIQRVNPRATKMPVCSENLREINKGVVRPYWCPLDNK